MLTAVWQANYPPRTKVLSSHSLGALEKLTCILEIDELEEGWDGLILALMYENSLPDSKWRPYLDLLPTQLNTPLFWSDEDLSYLKGTSLENRIGTERTIACYI